MDTLKEIFDFLKTVYREFRRDKAPLLAAAIAYYATFSIGPILLIAVAVAGFVFGEAAVQGRITEEIGGLIGRDGAEAVEGMIRSARSPANGVVATTIGVITLILAAAGLFNHLQQAINIAWGVEPPEHNGGIVHSIWETIRDRFLSFTMVLGTGFLLLVALIISAGIAAVDDLAEGTLPRWQWVLEGLDLVISLAIFTGLFAMIFKILPDVRVRWRDVFWGALFTAVMFTLGKFALGIYLGNSSFASTYRAAGSLVLILVWIYYSAQILLFGAKFTHVYARRYGTQSPSELERDEEKERDSIQREEYPVTG
ncbi:MAG: YihY/virulence factor BrkB family protein [Chloroflexi bacterium]|nr:YihY/virulence factor BrkB family protein [Chloroflexota bacterium]